MPDTKLTWSKVIRTRGASSVIVDIGIGEGQRGSASFVWDRSDGQSEDWDDVIPEGKVLLIDLGPGDVLPFSILTAIVLVKDFNPHTDRMSVDCRVYQEDRPDAAQTVQLYTPNDKSAAIVPFAIRLTFKQGTAV